MDGLEKIEEKLQKIIDTLNDFRIDFAVEKEKNRAHREDTKIHYVNGNRLWSPKLIGYLVAGTVALVGAVGKIMGWL